MTIVGLILNTFGIGFFIKAQLYVGTAKASIFNFSLNYTFTVFKTKDRQSLKKFSSTPIIL